MPLDRGLSRKATTLATSSVCDGLFAERGLLGVEIRIDVAGNAGRGRGFQQARRHGVEPHPRKPAERLGQKDQRRIQRRLDRGHVAVVLAGHAAWWKSRCVTTEASGSKQILERPGQGHQRKTGNVDRPQERLLGRFVERPPARPRSRQRRSNAPGRANADRRAATSARSRAICSSSLDVADVDSRPRAAVWPATLARLRSANRRRRTVAPASASTRPDVPGHALAVGHAEDQDRLAGRVAESPCTLSGSLGRRRAVQANSKRTASLPSTVTLAFRKKASASRSLNSTSMRIVSPGRPSA